MIESDISKYSSKRAGYLAASLTGGFVLPIAVIFFWIPQRRYQKNMMNHLAN
jgi:hypothetical protein